MPSPESTIPAGARARVRAFELVELAKPRLTALVLFTTLTGFCLGRAGPVPPAPLLHTLVGAGLLAAGAGTFNMIAERGRDALMRRTRNRLLASGRLSPRRALGLASALSTAGLAQLFLMVNAVTGLVALVVIACYLLVYTPLKTRTWWSVPAGAVSGALPVLIGWAGAAGSIPARAWILFMIVFLWQFPHFHAIGWLHRDDYARAGIPILSVIDRDGRRTGRQVRMAAAALLLCSLLPTPAGLTGAAYLGGALVLGAGFLACAFLFARSPGPDSARRLLVASALYLPLLLGLAALDKTAG
ncbi:MAG: protoheme IX farnesyltransferase [Acidobacteria bacterium]|nr:protoheme IX farnesyltransferase [Acidobacteriota bacterium]